MAQKKGIVEVLSGFSGVGQGTIMKDLVTEYPGMCELYVSATPS